MNEPKPQEFLFIHKQTGEIHKFIRTLLFTFVRDFDKKRFSTTYLYKVYKEANSKPKELREEIVGTKRCGGCNRIKYRHDFHSLTSHCRSCVAMAGHARRTAGKVNPG